jgi:hypothetical protein
MLALCPEYRAVLALAACGHLHITPATLHLLTFDTYLTPPSHRSSLLDPSLPLLWIDLRCPRNEYTFKRTMQRHIVCDDAFIMVQSSKSIIERTSPQKFSMASKLDWRVEVFCSANARS